MLSGARFKLEHAARACGVERDSPAYPGNAGKDSVTHQSIKEEASVRAGR